MMLHKAMFSSLMHAAATGCHDACETCIHRRFVPLPIALVVLRLCYSVYMGGHGHANVNCMFNYLPMLRPLVCAAPDGHEWLSGSDVLVVTVTTETHVDFYGLVSCLEPYRCL